MRPFQESQVFSGALGDLATWRLTCLVATRRLCQQDSVRFAQKFASIIYLSAAKESFLYHALQNPIMIGGQLVTMMKGIRFNSELFLRIPNHEVGIMTRFNNA